ncbi:MAG: single-stranded DNA-binding protein [Clostridiales bacterium]|nr:single-stranded DNA-binding protein [Clostridiales bacterium]
MNCVQIMGRLTDSPQFEEKDTLKIARYILAINNGKEKDTDFIPCTAYGNNAVVAQQYLNKGQLVAITGKLHSYKDKNECNKMNVIVNKQYFFGYSSSKIPSSSDGYIDFSNIDESTLPF